MTILTENKQAREAPAADAAVPEKTEVKKHKKFPLPLTLGLLGILGTWGVGQLIPLLSFDVPESERILLAKESVADFRQAQIDSGVYEALQSSVPQDILESVNRMIFYKTKHVTDGSKTKTVEETYGATATVVDQFIDVDGKKHKILLLNAHALPSEAGSEMSLKTESGLYTGTPICLPYDYIGENLYFVDQTKTIRDLALCDLRIIQAPENADMDVEPLDLGRFTTTQTYEADVPYTAYGFPVDPHMNEEQMSTEPNDSLVSNFSFDHTKNGLPYFNGDPYGPGGSGGVLLRDGQVEGIMTGYSTLKLTSKLNVIFGYNAGNAIWFVEPIPQDLREKIQVFKDMAINRDFQNVTIDVENLNYSYSAE